MGLVQQSLLGIGGGSLLGLFALMPMQPAAIAQTCVAQSSCPTAPIRVTPGKWVNFEIINRTGNIISIEQPSAVEAIALSPGQRITLGGTTKQNASFLFWDVQGLSVEARVWELSQNNLQIELLWGNGFGHYSVYLKDDGLIEVL
ncbi:hypothetical protein [[Limnothrix rosea] IAM M-220]|uniref:hypothetical protein n=1 Tax=[Limnothrix rosea] IAM M-220 TaxID=454133 RepID=UPI000959F267|nr:hypothetical protein [[Limnothrix rosea] IAM M-220]OKH17488.1 hypothetical protein NIES208_09100 [[Limnothrix rosea] IAM M-220]